MGRSVRAGHFPGRVPNWGQSAWGQSAWGQSAWGQTAVRRRGRRSPRPHGHARPHVEDDLKIREPGQLQRLPQPGHGGVPEVRRVAVPARQERPGAVPGQRLVRVAGRLDEAGPAGCGEGEQVADALERVLDVVEDAETEHQVVRPRPDADQAAVPVPPVQVERPDHDRGVQEPLGELEAVRAAESPGVRLIHGDDARRAPTLALEREEAVPGPHVQDRLPRQVLREAEAGGRPVAAVRAVNDLAGRVDQAPVRVGADRHPVPPADGTDRAQVVVVKQLECHTQSPVGPSVFR